MVPVFDFSRVIGFVKTVLIVTLVWTAFKTLVIGAIAVLVPYAIYSSWGFISEKVIEFGNSIVAGGAFEGTYIQLTGLAGWMAERLQLQACFQILASFVVMRYTLSFFKK